MRRLFLALFALLALPLAAGDGAEMFQFGYRVGLGVSPKRQYGEFQLNGETVEGKQALAGIVGLDARFLPFDSWVGFGATLDYLRPTDLAFAHGGDNGILQEMERLNLRVLVTRHHFLSEGWYGFGGPFRERVLTLAKQANLHEYKNGGMLGLGRTWFNESNRSIVEFAYAYARPTGRGTRQGGGTLEVTFGKVW